MNPRLIFELVELAITLAQAHMESEDLKDTLIEIVTKGALAYKEHTGEPMDPQMVGMEATL
jgi:hypothetical protein